MPRWAERTDEERFWAKVDKSGGPDACWPWVGAKDRYGYGNFFVKKNGKKYMEKAHRFAFEVTKGQLAAGMCSLHDCPAGDNPQCCNPAHLWAGSRRANNADRAKKGRSAHLIGELCPSHKLTEEQVREIRRRCRDGWDKRVVAVLFGVTPQAIGQIERRKLWKHIE